MIVYILLIHNLTNWSSCAGHAGSIGFHGDNPPVLSVLYAWMANGGIVSGLVLSLSSPAFCLEESMTEKFWHLSACCLLCVVYVLCWQFSHNQQQYTDIGCLRPINLKISFLDSKNSASFIDDKEEPFLFEKNFPYLIYHQNISRILYALKYLHKKI